jgi:hypothetical protein
MNEYNLKLLCWNINLGRKKKIYKGLEFPVWKIGDQNEKQKQHWLTSVKNRFTKYNNPFFQHKPHLSF